ncbi:MAG: flagellar export chaperone FliS [Chitinophagaceae bacterium]|nr:flagellar export chaperone FliS [Rubrivivax sp.]
MFASHYTSRNLARSPLGNIYQQVGVETGVGQATPHQLVALLFDGLLEAMAQARGAIRSGQTEVKGLSLGRAVRIIDEGLRAGLDMRAGGTLARDLDDLYAYLTLRLTQTNIRSDETLLDECQRLVQPLRDAWAAIGDSSSAR